MLHACAIRFDVMRNLEFFLKTKQCFHSLTLNNYRSLMFISCCLFVSNTFYSEDGPNDICSLTCEISCCLTLSFEVLSIFYVHTCSLLLMSSESLFLELISGEMSPWIVAESESCLWVWSLSCSFALTSLALWHICSYWTVADSLLYTWFPFLFQLVLTGHRLWCAKYPMPARCIL